MSTVKLAKMEIDSIVNMVSVNAKETLEYVEFRIIKSLTSGELWLVAVEGLGSGKGFTKGEEYQFIFTYQNERFVAYLTFNCVQFDGRRDLQIFNLKGELRSFVHRKDTRISTNAACHYVVKRRAIDSFGEVCKGTVRNISLGGMLLEVVPYEVELDWDVKVAVFINADTIIVAQGVVVGRREGKSVHKCGIRFNHLSKENLLTLESFIKGQES